VQRSREKKLKDMEERAKKEKRTRARKAVVDNFCVVP
jgi:hypothetical protein